MKRDQFETVDGLDGNGRIVQCVQRDRDGLDARSIERVHRPPAEVNFEATIARNARGRPGRQPLSLAKREAFIAALVQEPHIGRACTAAGTSRAAVYRLRDSDPEFAEAWRLAAASFTGRVLDAVFEEAIEGRPIHDDAGTVIDRVRDNRLLAAALRTLLGSGNSVTVNNAVQVNAPTVDPLAIIDAELARRRKAREAIDVEATPIDVADLLED